MDSTGGLVISNGEPNPVTFAPMTKKERERRACHLLGAAREGAAVLRAQCPLAERMEKVSEVAGHVAGLLGLPPGPAPVDAASQEKLVKAAGELAVLLRAYNWADSDISVTDLDKAADTPHVAERAAADGFDALGKLILPHATPEGWASELVTSAAKGDAKLEAGVKFAKYVLHPTPLLVLDDFTKMAGQAVHSLNLSRLNACVSTLRPFLQGPAYGPGRPCPGPDVPPGRNFRPDVLKGDLGKTREGDDVITSPGEGVSQHDPAVSTHEDRHDTSVGGLNL
ncbi:hypothetical protein [Streptomyces galbus]|uniref:Uncharacterized protein n=1 Tax=Streptomyces galbus TaxID=33898 RepID=A0A4U5WXJ6_STRGB|nr:hypothetical protein [Streptomyces galbus]TKT06622.1 hypothetical protein E4U92_26605 [Streptomyces galbus]